MGIDSGKSMMGKDGSIDILTKSSVIYYVF